MRIDISSNMPELRARLQQRIENVPNALRAGISDATFSLFAYSRKLLTQLIYNKPIPRRPRSGRPQWRWSYQLRNAERMAVSAPYRELDVEGQVFTDPSSPAWRYHIRRHDLTTRPAPWRTLALAQYGRRAAERFKAAVRAWLLD